MLIVCGISVSISLSILLAMDLVAGKGMVGNVCSIAIVKTKRVVLLVTILVYLAFSRRIVNTVEPDTNCGEVSKLFLNESHCVVLRCEPYLLVTKVFVYWQGKNPRSFNVSGASKEVHNLSVQVFDDLSNATDADYSYLVATEHDNNFFHSFHVPSKKRSKKVKVTGVNNLKQRSLSFADILIYSVDPNIDEENEEEFVSENIPKTPFSDHAARKSESLFVGTDLFFAILFGAVILVIVVMLAFYILIIAAACSERSFGRKSHITTSFTSTIKHTSVGSTRVSSGPYSTKRVSLASTVNGPQEGQTEEPDTQSKEM